MNLVLQTSDVSASSSRFSVNRCVVPGFLNQKVPVFDYYRLKGFLGMSHTTKIISTTKNTLK